MKARIESIGVYLPPKIVSTQAMLDGCANKVDFPLERLTGIKNRRVVDGEHAIDLSMQAVDRCLQASTYKAADIDLLICCNISRMDGPNFGFAYDPCTAVQVKQRFHLENALAFDINNACAGMFTGIFLAQRFLQTGAAKRALIVSGEYITHLAETAQKELTGFLDHRLACLTVGDAGAAVLLDGTTDDNAGFSAIDLYTLGKHCELCIAGPTREKHGGAIMHTDAIRITAAGLRQAVMHSASVLKQHDWEPESFQHLILHQTSRTTLQDSVREINALYKKRVLTDENVIDNLAERGNTATTTHIVAFKDSLDSGRIKPGDKVVFSITGSGLTIGTALYQHQGTPTQAPSAAPMRRLKLTALAAARRTTEDSTITLCATAAEKILAQTDRQAIDLLIHAGVYRSDFSCEPAIAARLQGHLKVNENAGWQAAKKTFAFDVSSGGVGFLYACKVAESLLQSGGTALLVTSDVENNQEAHDAFQIPLLGIEDSAGAALLSVSDDAGFERFLFKDFADANDVTHGGQKDGISYILKRQGADWRQRYLHAIKATVSELLHDAGLTPKDLDLAALPWIDANFARDTGAALELAQNAVILPPAQCKDFNTSGALFALQDAKPGTLALIVNVSAGIRVGAALYRF